MDTLYERIAALCRVNGMNITSMCKESGISRASLSDLKSGRNKTLKPDTLDKIADYFDTTVDYLLGRTEDPENADRFGLEDPSAPYLPHLTMDDFTYAMYEEGKELTEENKRKLIEMAQFFKQQQAKEQT